MIRRMSYTDIPRCAAIEAVNHLVPWTEDNFIDFLDRGGIGLVYEIGIGTEQGPIIAGYALMSMHDGEANLINVTVDEEYRGFAMGRELMEERLRIAREVGCNLAWGYVRPSNTASLSLILKSGGRIAGCKEAYYCTSTTAREDALVVRWNLNAQDDS